MPDINMSDEEAKKEYDDIQAEIAKEKGINPEKKEDPEKEEEKSEPAESEEDAADKAEDRPQQKREPLPEDGDEDIDLEDEPKDNRKVPLSKYQDTKKALEAEKAGLQSQVEKLTADLNREKTAKGISDKVKTYAEKHGMAEDAVLDLVQLVKGESELDKDTKSVIEKSALALKKAEAEEKFQTELSQFIAENPDAKGHEAELRAKAFEKGNLDKSLFEIFVRNFKTDAPIERKKTGEVSRTVSRTNTTVFNPQKIIEKVESGAAKPFEGLTDTQIDEVFELMEKTGSRYIKR